jgi:hypothetical protein
LNFYLLFHHLNFYLLLLEVPTVLKLHARGQLLYEQSPPALPRLQQLHPQAQSHGLIFFLSLGLAGVAAAGRPAAAVRPRTAGMTQEIVFKNFKF